MLPLFSSSHLKEFMTRYCTTGCDVSTNENAAVGRPIYSLPNSSELVPNLCAIIRKTADISNRYKTSLPRKQRVTWVEFQYFWRNRCILLETMRRFLPLFLKCFIHRVYNTKNSFHRAATYLEQQYIDIFHPRNNRRGVRIEHYRKLILIAPRQVGKSVGTAIAILGILGQVQRSPVGIMGPIASNILVEYITKDTKLTKQMYDCIMSTHDIAGFDQILGTGDFTGREASGSMRVTFRNSAGIMVTIAFYVFNSTIVGTNPDIILHDECFHEPTLRTNQTGESTAAGYVSFGKSIAPILQGRRERIYIGTTSVTSTANPMYIELCKDGSFICAIITVVCMDCMKRNRSCVCVHNIYRYGTELSLADAIRRSILCINSGDPLSRRNFIQEQLGIPQLGQNVVISSDALEHCVSMDRIFDAKKSRVLQVVIGVDPGHTTSTTAVSILFVLCAVARFGDLPEELRGSAVVRDQRHSHDPRFETAPIPDDTDEVEVRYSHIGIFFFNLMFYFTFLFKQQEGVRGKKKEK